MLPGFGLVAVFFSFSTKEMTPYQKWRGAFGGSVSTQMLLFLKRLPIGQGYDISERIRGLSIKEMAYVAIW